MILTHTTELFKGNDNGKDIEAYLENRTIIRATLEKSKIEYLEAE